MKSFIIVSLTATFGLAFAVAGHSGSDRSAASSEFPQGCAVAINGTIGFVPRAGLTIENRTRHSIVVFVEARGAVPRIELGTLAPGERKVFTHILPAGRNVLLGARPGETQAPRRLREVVQVNNHGAATCRRHYLWRIE